MKSCYHQQWLPGAYRDSRPPGGPSARGTWSAQAGWGGAAAHTWPGRPLHSPPAPPYLLSCILVQRRQHPAPGPSWDHRRRSTRWEGEQVVGAGWSPGPPVGACGRFTGGLGSQPLPGPSALFPRDSGLRDEGTEAQEVGGLPRVTWLTRQLWFPRPVCGGPRQGRAHGSGALAPEPCPLRWDTPSALVAGGCPLGSSLPCQVPAPCGPLSRLIL